MKNVFLNTTYALIITICFVSPKSWSVQQANLKLQGDTLNFEISGQKNWDYDLKRVKENNQTKVQLKIKGLDEQTAQNLKNVRNSFVKSVKVTPKAIDNYTQIEFVLNDDAIETFDYLTDQPSKLVVDFYRNEDAAVAKSDAPAANYTKNDSNKTKSQVASKRNATSKGRAPADVSFLKVQDDNGILTFVDQNVDLKMGLFDGADDKFTRFKIKETEIHPNAIIKGLSDYYLHFPMLEQEFSFWKTMKENPPKYTFVESNTEENKQARLLKTLFDKNRHLVLEKTTGWFEKKFPQSEYLESIYYMNADSQLALWKETGDAKYFDAANLFYEKATKNYPKSKLKERTSLFLGFINLDKKDYLTAIRKLNSHIENSEYKNKASQDYAKLGLAYAMLKVHKLEDALKLLNDVENNSKNIFTQAEAAYRKGDFYFHEDKFSEAVNAFNSAFKKYEKYSQMFPNAYFNKMEGLFRLQMPELSHTEALNFVQRFPSHEYAPYALTRVGELLSILGADQSKSVGAYLETHFRYGDNPKTIVARLHLLSTRMKVMKQQEVDETILKMDELADKSDLADVQQFKATMISDGFSRRQDYQKAINVLTQFYQKEPNKPNSNQITLRIADNISDLIKSYSDKSDFKNVLKTYSNYSDTWLKMHPRIDTDFYLAKAYQEAGVCSTALKKYDLVSQKISKLKDDSSSKMIRVTQVVPQVDEINLLQAQCLFEENKYQEAYEKMQSIKKPEGLSPKDQINRVYYTSMLYEKKGETSAAIRYLSELNRVWKDQPELLTPSVLHLADLEVQRKQPDKAIEVLQELSKKKINDDHKVAVLKKLSEISVSENKTKLATETLNTLLSKYEDKYSLAPQRFKLGEIYFSQGQLKKAEETWAELKGSDSDLWRKIAQNKLEDAKWNDENRKYLKRIPAAVKSEESLKQGTGE
ncbi:MAG: tetratricopeptide repeat protein [Pseudobdellovibrio sp.]